MLRSIARSGRLTAASAVLVISTIAAGGCGLLAASARTGGTHVIVLRDDANGKTVRAKVGERIELVLASDYWNVAGSSLPHVLRQDGPVTELPRPSSCPDIAGLGCTPVQANFSARAAGQAVIRATRTSCGEALECGPGERTFVVTVVVASS